jgi:gliding motility-associated-like protein
VFLPTGFTPNNDGLNDVWYPLGGGSLKVNYLKIFNRWGQLVFERTNILTNDRSAAWDGSFKGQPLPTGVFALTMGVSCENGEVVEMRGSVKLVR